MRVVRAVPHAMAVAAANSAIRAVPAECRASTSRATAETRAVDHKAAVGSPTAETETAPANPARKSHFKNPGIVPVCPEILL